MIETEGTLSKDAIEGCKTAQKHKGMTVPGQTSSNRSVKNRTFYFADRLQSEGVYLRQIRPGRPEQLRNHSE